LQKRRREGEPMRHIQALFTLSLTACSLVGGAAPAKLGAAPSGDSVKHGDLASKYEAATEVPRQLKSPQKSLELAQSKLEELEKKFEAGTLTNAEDIHNGRIQWLFFFGAMERGGEPRCDACKRNPEWIRMRAAAADIDKRYAKLEKEVAKCRYGYRMTNGDLLAMTLDLSEEEWTAIEQKALPEGFRQKERCWTNDKDGKAGKPNAWAY
jgi:hypothetical protein